MEVSAMPRSLCSAQRELLDLRGTMKFTIDLDELREDREWSQPTPRR
jgi:hypothetical protein